MSEAELQEIEQRVSKVRGDRWEAMIPENDADGDTYPFGYGAIIAIPNNGEHLEYELIVKVDDHDEQDDNLEFIANAREDVPKLLARVRELQRENEELRKPLEIK